MISRAAATVILLLFFCAQTGAEPASDPKTRAALYQAETVAVLQTNHWQVSHDQPGKLVADRLPPLPPPQPSGVVSVYMPGLERVTIQFQPKTVGYTQCSASIVVFYDSRGTAPAMQKAISGRTATKEHPIIGPLPFNDPEQTKTVRRLLAEAEKRLAAKHPEYSAK